MNKEFYYDLLAIIVPNVHCGLIYYVFVKVESFKCSKLKLGCSFRAIPLIVHNIHSPPNTTFGPQIKFRNLAKGK